MRLKLTDTGNVGPDGQPHELVGPRRQIDAYLAGPLAEDTSEEISARRIAGARRALTEGDVTRADHLLAPLRVRVERA